MTNPPELDCPQGEDGCPIYLELQDLQSSVVQLAQQVRMDPLTGLFNKQHLLSSLETEMERSCRNNHATSLIMLDVDKFKSVNDTYGHLMGDKVLAHVARIIKNAIRKIDIACRYGGEEFAIILPSTPLFVAAKVAERIRTFIEQIPFETNSQKLTVTASLGLSCYQPQDACNLEQLLEQADQLLYQAKASGRNKVAYAMAKPRNTHGITEAERLVLLDENSDS